MAMAEDRALSNKERRRLLGAQRRAKRRYAAGFEKVVVCRPSAIFDGLHHTGWM
jgi:hypothetical protein